MKVMLTSFGIGQERSSATHGWSIFYRMPPVSFRTINEVFMPDYELLMLCDHVVMDEASYHELTDRAIRAYSQVAHTFRALNAEGRVQLVDFSSIVRSNADLLDKMLAHDVKILDEWIAPLRDSLALWKRFVENSGRIWRDMPEQSLHSEVLMHEVRHMLHSAAWDLSYIVEEALDSSRKRRRKEYRQPLKEALEAYLAYVNSNLVLSNELGIGFHDWQDFNPFYSRKFLSVGKEKDAVQEGRKQVERLFTVVFPDLAIRDTSALLRAFNDRRIVELRQLVSKAVRGEVEFDEQFANAILTEVLRSERKSGRLRRVLGYVTLPIGFIPWIGTPVQKIAEEAIGTPLEKRIKREHQWFYMLSDIAEGRANSDDQNGREGK